MILCEPMATKKRRLFMHTRTYNYLWPNGFFKRFQHARLPLGKFPKEVACLQEATSLPSFDQSRFAMRTLAMRCAFSSCSTPGSKIESIIAPSLSLRNSTDNLCGDLIH